jgi:hypothetical protein
MSAMVFDQFAPLTDREAVAMTVLDGLDLADVYDLTIGDGLAQAVRWIDLQEQTQLARAVGVLR